MDIIRLKVFPFSLQEKRKAWLLSLRPNSIRTWQAMHDAFIRKFFPQHLTMDLMRQINLFTQKENKTFAQVWERFKDLLLSCPHHGFEKSRTITFFYDGHLPKMKKISRNHVQWGVLK